MGRDNQEFRHPMARLESIWDERHRGRVLTASALLVLAIAVVDWRTLPYLSLGFLYLFPIILAAGFLPRWAVALMGVGCAGLSEIFVEIEQRPLVHFELAAAAHKLSFGRHVVDVVGGRFPTVVVDSAGTKSLEVLGVPHGRVPTIIECGADALSM